MKLSHFYFTEPLQIKENAITVLVVENPALLRSLIDDLLAQENGLDGEFALSDGDDELEISKCVSVVLTPFNLEDINAKKVQTKLIQIINTELLDYPEQCADISSNVNSLLFKVCSETNYPVFFDPLDSWSNLLKALNVRIEMDGDSLAERVIEYLTIRRDLLSEKLFVIYGLHQFLSENELRQLYTELIYKKINVILIESAYTWNRLESEEITIIDKDMCFI